jgi:hypothetical protein
MKLSYKLAESNPDRLKDLPYGMPKNIIPIFVAGEGSCNRIVRIPANREYSLIHYELWDETDQWRVSPLIPIWFLDNDLVLFRDMEIMDIFIVKLILVQNKWTWYDIPV